MQHLLEAFERFRNQSMRMFCARSIRVSMMVLEWRSVPSESMNILSILIMSTPSLSMYDRPL